MEPGAWIPFLSRRVTACCVAIGCCGIGGTAAAKTFATREVALRRAFGAEAQIERRTAFLTPAQLDSACALAAAPIAPARVSYHEASRGDSLLGRAYLDTHRVRNEHETILIVVTPAGETQRVEILAFDEPEDYLPPAHWLQTLTHRSLSRRLRPGDAVDAISGATLSARAATEAVRRVLALDRILHGSRR